MSDTEQPGTGPGSGGAADSAKRFSVPSHVVFREFPSETVVLNLDTGKYHGLNPTAGTMLSALQTASDVSAAAAIVAGTYGRPEAEVEQDLRAFCAELLSRGLVEVDER